MAKYITIICRVKGHTVLRLSRDFDSNSEDHVYYYSDSPDDDQQSPIIDNHKVDGYYNDVSDDNYDLNRVKQEVIDPLEESYEDNCQKLLDDFDRNFSLVPQNNCENYIKQEENLMDCQQNLDSYQQYLSVAKSGGRQLFLCKWKNCSYQSLWRNAIANHIRNHMKYFPFVCEYSGCDKSFAIASNLRNHHKVHVARKQRRLSQDITTYNEDQNPYESTNESDVTNNLFNGSHRQKQSLQQKSKHCSTNSALMQQTNGFTKNKVKQVITQKKKKSFVDKITNKYVINRNTKKSVISVKTRPESPKLKVEDNNKNMDNNNNNLKVKVSDNHNNLLTKKPTIVGIKSVKPYFNVQHRDQKTWRCCKLCTYETPYATSIIYHMKNVHFDDKQYVCNICGNRYAMKTNLNNHKNVHKTKK